MNACSQPDVRNEQVGLIEIDLEVGAEWGRSLERQLTLPKPSGTLSLDVLCLFGSVLVMPDLRQVLDSCSCFPVPPNYASSI